MSNYGINNIDVRTQGINIIQLGWILHTFILQLNKNIYI